MYKKIYKVMSAIALAALTFGSFAKVNASSATAPVLATTYYVSMSGSDANAGTSESKPWKTIKKVNSQTFKSGDKILFKRGDTWMLNNGGEAGALVITSSGITIGAYGSGSLPLFNGTSAQDWRGIVAIDNVSYVTIENLDLYNSLKEVIGISPSGNSHHITIQNCIIRTNRTPGYMLIYMNNHGALGSTNNIIIRNNHIYNSQWNAMRLSGGLTDVTISGNLIHDTAHGGIDTYPSKINNKNVQIFDNEIYAVDTVGIYLPAASSFTIYNNRIHDLPVGIKVAGEAGFVGNNNVVRNNQVWNTSEYALWVDSCTDCSVLNNTLHKNASTLLNLLNTRLVVKDNLAYTNTKQGTNNILTNFSVDPQFVNVSTADFHLKPSSPACTAAANKSYIGAFSCGSVASPVTPTNVATKTPTVVASITATSTLIAPSMTSTALPGATNTAAPASVTPAASSVPASPIPASATSTASSVPVLPTLNQPSATPIPATRTASPVPVQPTAVQPTATAQQQPTQQTSETIFDDKGSAFAFSSDWKDVAIAASSGGSFKKTTEAGISATFTFTGQSFSVLYTAGPKFASVNVYVDNKLVGKIIQTSSATAYKKRWNYSGQLTPGQHTIKFVVVEDNGMVNGSIDAVIVR